MWHLRLCNYFKPTSGRALHNKWKCSLKREEESLTNWESHTSSNKMVHGWGQVCFHQDHHFCELSFWLSQVILNVLQCLTTNRLLFPWVLCHLTLWSLMMWSYKWFVYSGTHSLQDYALCGASVIVSLLVCTSCYVQWVKYKPSFKLSTHLCNKP